MLRTRSDHTLILPPYVDFRAPADKRAWEEATERHQTAHSRAGFNDPTGPATHAKGEDMAGLLRNLRGRGV